MIIFFFFNRLCNPCGFWPAQLSLSILSKKGFTECCCQQHVKPPTWRTSDLESSNSRHNVSLAPETTRANPSSERWNHGREISENFAESGDFHVTFGFFYTPKIYDMGPTALLSLRRKARWGFFFRQKNPTVLAGFEPAKLGTIGQHNFMIISHWITLTMRNVSNKLVEKIKTHISCSITRTPIPPPSKKIMPFIR